MKRPSRFLLVALGVLLLLGCSVPALAAPSAGETLIVGVPVDRCPIFYIDPDTREVTGIGVDLMRTAAESAGYCAYFKPIAETTLKEALDSENYDVVMPFGSAISSSSGRATVVSDNLTQTQFTLVTEDNRRLPPLKEMRVGMLRSQAGVADTVRSLFPGIDISLFDSMDECVKALRREKVDALLHNSYVWSYVLQKPSYSDLAIQPSVMFSMDFRVGTLDTPEGRELIERLNGGIAEITETRRQSVILEHSSRRLYHYDLSDFLYQYGVILLLTLLLFAALAVISVLKRRELRLEQEQKLRQLIEYDPLTGALSLSGFRRRVEELLRAHPDVQYMLSYNNIRNFKYINDSLGMSAGDELLCFWFKRTRETISELEAVGRIEGDHLALLRRVVGDEGISQDAANVLNPVRSYFVDRGRGNLVQLCSGIYVLSPEDYKHIDVDHMLDCARVAEKRVRDTRNEGFGFYNPLQWEKGKRVAYISGHLPLALGSEEIQIWYQPQVDYKSGMITGAEALCRWNHPKLGWLRPAEFIPMLEESELIYELDCYVWDKVCQDLRRWNEQGQHLSVSVNLARRDIREDRDIPGHFADLVKTYGLSTDQLRIEITESAYVDDPELLIRTTMRLREFGFHVEMDDFGSGYSSLHMLKEVPVDRIKLDLHFLTSSGDPERGQVIISYMIQMIHSLGMDLISEGVESAAQADFLQSRGCSDMQGFYFYKPMSEADFEALMKKQ